LLDEPTNHLDMESIDSLLEAIDAFEGAVVIVTHSEMILHAIATRLIVFDDGKVRVFEGTYQDFLDRVGWKSEITESQNSKGQNNEQTKGASKKDMRRIRAELINSRSRILGVLQKRITGVEETIMHLENQIEQDTQAPLEVSVKGEGQSIKTLSKSIHESKAGIDTLFDELSSLTEELEHQDKGI